MSTLSTSTSQLASVPNSCVHVPIRPYTDGARRGGELASHPPDLAGARSRSARPTRSGEKAAASAAHRLEARDVLGERAGVGQPLVEQRVHERERAAARRCRGG